MDEEGEGGREPHGVQEGSAEGELEGKEKGWRVKLYQLNAEGQWDDQGTGYITCDDVESGGGKSLLVMSEADEKQLLRCAVVEDDVYQRQGDNIITWCEPAVPGSGGVDLALSFQENQGCSEIWGQICNVQGRFSMDVRGQEDLGTSGSGDERGIDVNDDTQGANIALPTPTMENLEAIQDQLSTAIPFTRENLAASVYNNDGQFITKLLGVFDDCEDLEDTETLQKICGIFKALFSLNDGNILDTLLSDQFFIPVIGVFEYDPELRQKVSHREWFRNSVKFNEVLPITDMDVLSKIHQNFRAVFFRDVLLRHLMDDSVASTLNSVVCYNNAEIIMALYVGSDYLKNVFALLPSEKGNAEREGDGVCSGNVDTGNGASHPTTPPPSLQGGEAGVLQPQARELVLRFIRELFDSAKTLHPTPREDLFRYLWNEVPLFDVMVPVLADSEATELELTCCLEAILHTLQYDLSMMRTHVMSHCIHPPPSYNATVGGSGKDQLGGNCAARCGSAVKECASTVDKCNSLLFWVIRRLTSEKSSLGVLAHTSEICRLLLDVETMETQTDRDSFLGVFYDYYIDWLVQPLWTPISGDVTCGEDRKQGAGSESMNLAVKGHVCDLLSLCVESHTFRMKYYVIRNHIASLVLKLVDQPFTYLQLTALRFLRRCVGVKDQVYNRYIIKNSLLAPIFAVLKNKSSIRDSLFTSAVAELIEFVRTENVKSLVEYIVENFAPVFSCITWAPAFQTIMTKYEQNRDYVENAEREMQLQSSGGGNSAGRMVGGERGGGVTGSSLNWTGASSMKRFSKEDQDEAYFNESDDESSEDRSWEEKEEDAAHEYEEGSTNQLGEAQTVGIHDSNTPLLPLRRSISCTDDDDEEPFKLRALNSRIAVPSAVTKHCPPSKFQVKMSSSLQSLVGGNLAKGESVNSKEEEHMQKSELSPSTADQELQLKQQHKGPLQCPIDDGNCNVEE